MTILDCIKATAKAFGITVRELRWGGRAHFQSHPRQAAMLLARWEGFAFERIGRALGNRDHSTIVHGCRAAEKRFDADEEYGDLLQTAWLNLKARPGR